MKQKIVALAICASLYLTGTASADWMTGSENRFFISNGSGAVRMSLTAQQTLKIAVSVSDTGTADFYFLYGDRDDSDAFSLRLPCLIETDGGERNALVSVTPIVDSGNGRRFYYIDTGVPAGCLLLSYSNGLYKTAFDAASIEGNWTSASIEVQKKQLVLHLKNSAGNTQDHILKYDKKNNLFSAEDSLVSTITLS